MYAKSIKLLAGLFACVLVSACWESEYPLLTGEGLVMPLESSTGNLLLTCGDDETVPLVIGETHASYGFMVELSMVSLDMEEDGHPLYLVQAEFAGGDDYFYQIIGLSSDMQDLMGLKPIEDYAKAEFKSREALMEAATDMVTQNMFSLEQCALTEASDSEVLTLFRRQLN
ncbi:hypothetical protein [Ponticaulis profundi]|uniref:Lipoprotein n=1 Tax=Ponticaulis profundi TaxID=2665222 RepID=A0ABW1SBR5_9PROT